MPNDMLVWVCGTVISCCAPAETQVPPLEPANDSASKMRFHFHPLPFNVRQVQRRRWCRLVFLIPCVLGLFECRK
jgi:hypothetical protein